LEARLECDLLLFYATGSEEMQLKKVARELGLKFQDKRHPHPHLGSYHRIGKVGDFAEVVAVKTKIGPFGYQGSASKGIFFKVHTPATAIVQLGMAFGVDPGQQKLGDVLVSSSLIPYDRKKVHADGDSYRYDYTDTKPEPVRPSMLEFFMREADKLGKDGKSRWPFGIHVGIVLSGGSAIYSTKFRNELLEAFRSTADPIVGGEMEAVGLVSVSPPDDPAWIMVKGISDFAEDTRENGFKSTRDQACRNSAFFVLSALKEAKQP
jgi:nucleoside phosphorylase